jgi:hypothetical protein
MVQTNGKKDEKMKKSCGRPLYKDENLKFQTPISAHFFVTPQKDFDSLPHLLWFSVR